MRLLKHPSLLVAERVVKAMRPLLAPHHPDLTLYIEPYGNGRERGLAIIHDDNIVTIAEHRNSDGIRVWYGSWLDDFELNYIPLNGARDRCFEPNAYAEAAAFCAYYLLLNQSETK